MNRKSPLFPIITGLLTIAVGQIISHYFKISDFVWGAFIGAGLGIMLLAFFRKKPKQA